MAIVTKRRLASPVIALVALTTFAGAASAATGVTTNTVTLPAASEGVVALPALNSQFTKMTITVNDGTANWGANDLGYWTTYQGGAPSTGYALTSGIWGDESLPGHGPLLLEGTQVGTVIYRVDGGAWNELTKNTTVSTSQGTHVEVAYNDRPGSYDDNSGALSITFVRTKA
jgi:hypothetical protein